MLPEAKIQNRLNLNHRSVGNSISFLVGPKCPNIYFFSVLLDRLRSIGSNLCVVWFTFPSMVVKKLSLPIVIYHNCLIYGCFLDLKGNYKSILVAQIYWSKIMLRLYVKLRSGIKFLLLMSQ